MSLSTEKITPNALRNVSIVTLHKVAQLLGQIVAVFTIPRLLGADDHGRFAFVLSLGLLTQFLGDFGTLEVMTRFVPPLSSPPKRRQLYMRILAFKTILGVLCGLITFGAALSLSHWMRLDYAFLISVGVLAHVIAWVPFQFLLGLNRVGLWMVEQSWRQWTLVVLLLVLYPWLGLGGAILAWTLMELIFCLLGLWWTRHYWQLDQFRPDWTYLWPYLRFGFGFFMANLLGAMLYRSGPVLVETFTGQSAQAGFLNLALGLYLMPYLYLTQFALSLIPTLSDFYTQGQRKAMDDWIHSLIRYSWLLGWIGTIGIWLTADLAVIWVFGSDYAPAAAALKWISLGIPLAGPVWGGNIVAVVTEQGRVKFGASVIALLTFLGGAIWLIPAYAAAGAAMALSLAVVANLFALLFWLRDDFSLEWPLILATGLLGIFILWSLEYFQLTIIHWGWF